MSLSGAVDGRSRPQPADGAGRGHVIRSGRPVPPPKRRDRAARAVRGWRHRRFLAVLVAVALGAGGALALLVVAVPGALASATGETPAAARSAGPPPASEVVVPAVVVTGSSCLDADAHDVVGLALDGTRYDVPLDGCGAIVGSTTTVRVLAADGAGGPGHRVPRGTARILGTGGATPLTDPTAAVDAADAPSPMAGRITVTLTVLAGIAMAGLLVALGREGMRSRGAAAAGPARAQQAGAQRAGTERPGTPRPATERPGTQRPVTERPATGRPGTERNGTERPGTDQVGTQRPGAERPDPQRPDPQRPDPARPDPQRPGTEPADPGQDAADDGGANETPAAARARSRARSLRAPHPARSVRSDGRLGPGAERVRRGPSERPRSRRPR